MPLQDQLIIVLAALLFLWALLGYHQGAFGQDGVTAPSAPVIVTPARVPPQRAAAGP
jgi:hypothetical protein